MKVFTSSRHDELGSGQTLPPPPWYRRPGILIAAAALIAEVGIVVSGAGEPGTAPDGTTGTSTPWSASFSLIATDFWEPPPEPPPAAPPPAAPPAWEPPAPAPRRAAPPAWEPPQAVLPPPPPPPPPPPELVLRQDDPLTVFVSITNNANKPAVGCMERSVAVAGTAAMVNYTREYPFTVTGSAETRIDPNGPATGSTFHVTVTCDNGLSAIWDGIY